MFVLQQKIAGVWVDYSCHSLSVDADWQKAQLVSSGITEENIQVVEKDTYSPPNKI